MARVNVYKRDFKNIENKIRYFSNTTQVEDVLLFHILHGYPLGSASKLTILCTERRAEPNTCYFKVRRSSINIKDIQDFDKIELSIQKGEPFGDFSE